MKATSTREEDCWKLNPDIRHEKPLQSGKSRVKRTGSAVSPENWELEMHMPVTFPGSGSRAGIRGSDTPPPLSQGTLHQNAEDKWTATCRSPDSFADAASLASK